MNIIIYIHKFYVMNSHCEKKHSKDRSLLVANVFAESMYSYARRNSTSGKNRQNQHYEEHTTKLQCSHTQIHHKNHHYRNGTIRSIQIIALVVVGGTVVPAVAIVTSIRFDLYV